MDGGNGLGVKERLTRDRICEVALEAIDEAGLESLSMRMLASALGVKASSLYYHFENKEGLLTGVAENLYRKLARPPSGGDWAEQAKGTFIQLWGFVASSPQCCSSAGSRSCLFSGGQEEGERSSQDAFQGGARPDRECDSYQQSRSTSRRPHVSDAVDSGRSGIGDRRLRAGMAVMGPASTSTLDGSRAWVHKVLDGRAKSEAMATGDPPSEIVYDVGFIAGLDALIRGYCTGLMPPVANAPTCGCRLREQRSPAGRRPRGPSLC